MRVDPVKVQQAKAAGYSDREITDYLRNQGFGDQIDAARLDGASLEDIRRSAAGEKTGFVERAKQGMADLFLSTGQMASEMEDAIGLGTVTIGMDGINYIDPEGVKLRKQKFQDAITLNEERKGEAGIGAQFISALANPATFAGGPLKAGGGLLGLMKQGAISGGALEAATPQNQGFDLGQKVQDVGIASLLGGVAVPVVDKVVRGAGKVLSKTPGRQALRAAAIPFTKKGAQPKAADRLRELVPDPEAALANLAEEPLVPGLTAAQRTQDPRLMGLERQVRRENPAADTNLAEANDAATRQLTDELGEIGEKVSPDRTTDFIKGRRDEVVNKLQNRAATAEGEAVEATSVIAPKQRPSENSITAREEIESALSAEREIERNLFSKVPRELEVATTGTKASLDDILANTPRAQADDIPASARKFFDEGAEVETLGELQGLRSKLLEEGRQAKADGRANAARIANDLADSLLDDLGARAGSLEGDAGAALREALDQSRQLSERFKRGSVKRVLGSDKAGGSRIAPELTLDATIGAGKTKGAVAADELLAAAPESKSLSDSIADQVRNNFDKSAVKNGAVDPKAANKFFKENADLLDRFPELRDELGTAAGKQATASTRAAKASNTADKLSSSKSVTGDFLSAKVDKSFEKILAAKDPAAAAREIAKQASKDKTGNASKGLKTAAIEYLVSKSADSSGAISGKGLAKQLSDKRTLAALKEVLSPEELSRVNRVKEAFDLVAGQKAKEVGGVLKGNPNKLVELLVRVQGAKTGAKLAGDSGASLVTAGFVSKNSSDILKKITKSRAEKLLVEAVQDPALMKILLTRGKTMAEREVTVSKLAKYLGPIGKGKNAAIGGVAGQQGSSDERNALKVDITKRAGESAE